VNDPKGLEQGFTISPPPSSSLGLHPSSFILALAVRGTLRPSQQTPGGMIQFQTDGGVTVMQYASPKAVDATGKSLPIRMSLIKNQSPNDANNSSNDISSPTSSFDLRPSYFLICLSLDASGAQFPITIDPLITTTEWTAEGNQAGARFGCWVSTAGDVNNDGYDDVIVGAPLYDNGETDEGKVFLYYGSASGLSDTPSWTAESNQADAQMGESVSTAGDVNNDGYADVIIGVINYTNDDFKEGRAYVYHGSASGLSPTPNWMAEGGQYVAQFGGDVSTAGDVNGDGYDDVIVGSVHWTNPENDEGRAYVFYGSASGLSTTPNWTKESNQIGASFGAHAVASAGDVNGDGYDDVIVGANGYDNDQIDEGMAFVFYGSSSGLSSNADWIAEGNQTNCLFGYSVSTAGDVNNDGFSDVIVGAEYYSNGQAEEGVAFVWFGSASGLGPNGTPSNADWTAESNQAGSSFGRPVAMVGDVNGDGYDDVIVGAHRYDNGETDEGVSFVWFGSASGLGPNGTPSNADWTAESNQAGAIFGYPVASAGDVNGDGYSDIVIGAQFYDNLETDEGKVWLYYGSTAGPVILPPPTPTPTPTPTSTATATPTATSTDTATPTATATSTATATATATSTPTATATSTATPTPTATATSTATASPTPTPTPCPTVKATIRIPKPGKRINGNRTLVRALVQNNLIRYVQKVLFQYRIPSEIGLWQDIVAANPRHPNPDTSHPWFVHWDVTGISEGLCDIRAIAYNYCDEQDPNPTFITVIIDHHNPQSIGRTGDQDEIIQEDILNTIDDHTVGSGHDEGEMHIVLGIPGAALDSATTCTITWLSDCGHPDCSVMGWVSMNAFADVTLSSGQTQFSEDIFIEFEYPDGDQDGTVDGTIIPELTLAIYYYDDASNKMTLIPNCVVDPVANTVSCQVSHFTVFSLYGQETLKAFHWNMYQ